MEFGELCAMMAGTPGKHPLYAESSVLERRTRKLHLITSKDNLPIQGLRLSGNFGLTMSSAREVSCPSMSAAIALGEKQTVGTKKMRFFAAQGLVYASVSKRARPVFTKKEKNALSATRRVARALVCQTGARPAQPVITRKTKHAWLNVGVVSI